MVVIMTIDDDFRRVPQRLLDRDAQIQCGLRGEKRVKDQRAIAQIDYAGVADRGAALRRDRRKNTGGQFFKLKMLRAGHRWLLHSPPFQPGRTSQAWNCRLDSWVTVERSTALHARGAVSRNRSAFPAE